MFIAKNQNFTVISNHLKKKKFILIIVLCQNPGQKIVTVVTESFLQKNIVHGTNLKSVIGKSSDFYTQMRFLWTKIN
jgi:hypothetical protein